MPANAHPGGLPIITGVFEDDFQGTTLGEWWKPLNGKWQQENGNVTGQGENDFNLSFLKQLPESTGISFESLVLSSDVLPASDLRFVLHSVNRTERCYSFNIGAHAALLESDPGAAPTARRPTTAAVIASRAQVEIAQILEQEGKFDEAIREYEKVRDLYSVTPLGLQAPIRIMQFYKRQTGRGRTTPDKWYSPVWRRN